MTIVSPTLPDLVSAAANPNAATTRINPLITRIQWKSGLTTTTVVFMRVQK